MSNSVRLHREHGVNPTIPLCFWCGKPRNEVVLLGAAYKGQAPRRMLMDYEPCDTCKANMAQGITLIEATHKPQHNNQTGIQEDVYPTGRWAVITEEAVPKAFDSASSVAVLKHRKAFIDVAAAEKLGLFRTAES